VKAECPAEKCDYEIRGRKERDLKTGLKVHVSKAHPSRQIELYKRVDERIG